MNRSDGARLLLRWTVAVLLAAHGVARAYLGSVGEFGALLGSVGVPTAIAAAWAITALEAVGGVLLAIGKAVRPLCVWFAAQLVAGIVIVHAQAGWFVVGEGRNGSEYNVLLIACLAAIAMSHGGERRTLSL